MTTTSYLDRFLDPVAEVLSPEAAQRLVDLKVDDQLKTRIEELGCKANEGTLTPDEDAEYKDYVETGDLIALLQAKARRVLARQTS